MAFLNSNISQGSVVMQLRCGGIISQGFVANLLYGFYVSTDRVTSPVCRMDIKAKSL